jgi:hypothetical protein
LAHVEHHSAHPHPAAHVLVDWVGGLLDHRSFHDASESLMRGRAARISPYDFGSFEASHRIWQGVAVLADAPHSATLLNDYVIDQVAVGCGNGQA